jgi:exodeoxyribonuclease III
MAERKQKRVTRAPRKQAAIAPRTLRIATFNINNINRRLDNLRAWLTTEAPDIVCLQELKADQHSFPEAELRELGYHAVWRGQKTWNGVAILSKNSPPVVTRWELPGNPEDKQSRYLEAAVEGIVIASIYLPNGNPQPGPKFDYKLSWLGRLIRHANKLRKAGVPVVLAGDFNVVPTDLDIYPTRSWDKDALLQPESRAAYRKLLKQGWTDAYRKLHPTTKGYTFWDYKRNRWPRDAGLRLDHFLLSPDLARRVSAAGVDKYMRGEPNASDHAPAWITLKRGKRPAQP